MKVKYTMLHMFIEKHIPNKPYWRQVVKEVIHYYIENKSDSYSCCVDMSKAFDWVRHDRFVQLLIEHKVTSYSTLSIARHV